MTEKSWGSLSSPSEPSTERIATGSVGEISAPHLSDWIGSRRKSMAALVTFQSGLISRARLPRPQVPKPMTMPDRKVPKIVKLPHARTHARSTSDGGDQLSYAARLPTCPTAREKEASKDAHKDGHDVLVEVDVLAHEVDAAVQHHEGEQHLRMAIARACHYRRHAPASRPQSLCQQREGAPAGSRHGAAHPKVEVVIEHQALCQVLLRSGAVHSAQDAAARNPGDDIHRGCLHPAAIDDVGEHAHQREEDADNTENGERELAHGSLEGHGFSLRGREAGGPFRPALARAAAAVQQRVQPRCTVHWVLGAGAG